jgi:hypothetical protein
MRDVVEDMRGNAGKAKVRSGGHCKVSKENVLNKICFTRKLKHFILHYV